MVTRVQKQTAWAPWLQNLAETLEPHLAEIKHQGESKLRHPEPLAYTKLLHAMLHWEKQEGSNHLQALAPNIMKGEIQQTKQVSTKYHVIFPQPTLG
jgi:hypothetical protein